MLFSQVNSSIFSPVVSCDSELCFDTQKTSNMKEELNGDFIPASAQSLKIMMKKYGITAKKTPRKTCVRRRHVLKTSTPRGICPKRFQRNRGPATPIKTVVRKATQKVREEKNGSTREGVEMSAHLKLWDRQLENIKQRTEKLRKRDVEIRERYERIKQTAGKLLGDNPEEIVSLELSAKVSQLHESSASFGESHSIIQGKKSALHINANICNVYYCNPKDRDCMSPLRTVFKDGKKCTFC